jgi:alpha-1,3-glucan synthase
MAEWPDSFQLNVWGMNPDGKPDASAVFGDIDGDFILDRLPPSSLSKLAINISAPPPSPFLAYSFTLNDGLYKYDLIPVGNGWLQLALYLLLGLVPVLTGVFAIWVYMKGFYQIKFNEIGISEKASFLRIALRSRKGNGKLGERDEEDNLTALGPPSPMLGVSATGSEKRRSVLIATMEYGM